MPNVKTELFDLTQNGDLEKYEKIKSTKKVIQFFEVKISYMFCEWEENTL